MDEQTFKNRTKRLALRVVAFVQALPKEMTTQVMGKQLLRAATAIGANYRAACRGKSTADVIAKLGVVEEESDEALYWMELFLELPGMRSVELSALMTEADEILSMTVASIKTLRRRADNRTQSKIQNPTSPLLESKGFVSQSKIQNPKSKISIAGASG